MLFRAPASLKSEAHLVNLGPGIHITNFERIQENSLENKLSDDNEFSSCQITLSYINIGGFPQDTNAINS